MDPAILRRLAKVELHLHLEGAIPLETLWELVKKYGAQAEVRDLVELKRRFEYRDFPHFLETWQWKNGFLREYEDFTFITSAVAQDLAQQNVRYVEAFHSPGDFAVLHGLSVPRITEAVRKGLDEHASEIEVKLIADLTRDWGPERGMGWLHELAELGDRALIGIGLGGSEQSFPPETYRDVYEQARRYGFHTTAHAGEAAGAESIWGALRALGVERIGHGVRAIEDEKLVAYLKEHQIPLEVCPVSNVRTGVVARLEEHPLKDLYAAGLRVSIHTDDPKMFHTRLEDEYAAVMRHLDFGLADVMTLARNAIDSAWCDTSRKIELHRELDGSLEG